MVARTAGQFFVDVTDPWCKQCLVYLRNVGPIASFIDGVYFMDGTLLGISSIINGTGVAFSNPANPADLPPQNMLPSFRNTRWFFCGHQSGGCQRSKHWGASWNSVQSDSGQEFAQSLAALANGTLRIGIHVQGIGASGFSDSFVNTPGGGGPNIPYRPRSG